MTVIRQEDFIAQRRRRAAVHQLLPPGRLHHQPGQGLRARAVSRRQRRHRADPHQQPHVRRGPPAHLPGHGHRERLRQSRHGCPLRARRRAKADGPAGAWSTRACAAPISTPTTSCAPRILADPAGARKNTRDNTPAVVNVELVQGDKVDVTVAAKGGGSEAKCKFAMLNPSDSVVEWVLKTVPTMGAGWCPPGMLGIGIGGTAEKAMLLAKQSLMDPIDIQELIARGPQTTARSCASNSTTRSTRSASALRAWAA